MSRRPRTSLRKLRKEAQEVLERHELTRDLSDFAEFADEPVRFIRGILGDDPWSKQVEIARAVATEPQVCVVSANGVGKGWLAARLALWFIYGRRGRVLMTAPTLRQGVGGFMKEVRRAFVRAPDLPGELLSQELRISREEVAGLFCFTSNEVSALTGFHAPRVMCILDEAQAIPDYAWEGMAACAVGAEDRFLVCGNPLRPSGRFYQVATS